MNPQPTYMIVQACSAELRRKASSLSADTPAPLDRPSQAPRRPNHRPGRSDRASRTMRWLAHDRPNARRAAVPESALSGAATALCGNASDRAKAGPTGDSSAGQPSHARSSNGCRPPCTVARTAADRGKGKRAGARKAPSEARPWISPAIGSGPTESMRAAPVNPARSLNVRRDQMIGGQRHIRIRWRL